MTNFGSFPKSHTFTPPNPTRGGTPGAFERKEEAPLTGFVKDRQAAKGEERFARSIYKGIAKGKVLDLYFRWTLGLIPGMAGSRELDFFVFCYGFEVAIAVDGQTFVHRGSAAHHKDIEGDMLFMARLRTLGYDVPEIIHISAESLVTQELADQQAKKLNLL